MNRIRNPTAMLQAVLMERACVICGKPSATAHHVYKRSQGGDDVTANLVALCGSGTTGCHGRIENEEFHARGMLGEYLVRRRPDTIDYLEEKLGTVESHAWLERRLLVTV